MYLLRQMGSTLVAGAQTSEAATPDLRHQIVDMNPRYIMQLLAPGKYSWGQGIAAGGAGFSIQVPQNYVNTNLLHVVITTDQNADISIPYGSTSVIAVRAGLNQVGVLSQCGIVTGAITVTPPSSITAAANVEWFLFELPNILSVNGWRDGSLATGTQQP